MIDIPAAHAMFEVSCKLVVFDRKLEKVAVVKYMDSNMYGIPGGHLEESESLEDAARREYFEETGDEYHGSLRKCGFYKDQDLDKIVLIFAGKIEEERTFGPIDNRQERVYSAEWIPVEEAEYGAIDMQQHNREIIMRCRVEMSKDDE